MSEPRHVALARALVGEPGSRHEIPTPAAILDLDAFEANLALMAGRAQAAGVALRPHAKSHKSAWIAYRQFEADAAGVCCAKLAEAEALEAAGIGSILLTSPISGTMNAERAAWLSREMPDFRLVVDHPDGVAELAAAETPMQVLIDVDVGLGRTGVADAHHAADLARAILRHPRLRLLGVQGYGGHWQHMADPAARREAVAQGMSRLRDAIDAIRGVGGEVEVVTGGGTGSFQADVELGVLNELQPGSYLFMDREYREALDGEPAGDFRQALFVATTVISANHPKWVTLDAGLKALSTDGPLPLVATPGFEDAAYGFFGDEHGRLARPAGRHLRRGDRLDLIPGHIDPTIDRHDRLWAVRGDVLEAVIPIDARGASQ